MLKKGMGNSENIGWRFAGLHKCTLEGLYDVLVFHIYHSAVYIGLEGSGVVVTLPA